MLSDAWFQDLKILNLKSRNKICGKLLLSQKLRHFRGSRFSHCLILSTSPRYSLPSEVLCWYLFWVITNSVTKVYHIQHLRALLSMKHVILHPKEPKSSMNFIQARFVHSSMEESKMLVWRFHCLGYTLKGDTFQILFNFCLITLESMWKSWHKM